ncbi:NACHT domain-containing NTPase [Actinomadura sp. K4S16]|uniref:NACHT domain-containing protein n=1 Tax=Actinomadura sp. K4S16 TaxID=1316147 RepID=UPI0011EE09EF|nr:hypothetical protein [Actinomadura sp. K4S16]
MPPVGRPAKSERQVYPELQELAAWFRQALADAGYASVNAFVQRLPFEKNQMYGIYYGTRFLAPESMRAVAAALDQDVDAVMALWLKAKHAKDRRAAAEAKDKKPRVTSWADLPRPELALENLLDPQSKAVEQLPYELLRVRVPPLSAIYVRQHVRARAQRGSAEADGMRADDGAERAPRGGRGREASLGVKDALNRHDHLVVMGEPGSGKSTLSQHLTLELSQIWLGERDAVTPPVEEPVVPLWISAWALATEGTWSAVLATAAHRALGRALVDELPPRLFSGRTQGCRWMIFIDGLDEILDRATRASVIQSIGQHAKAGGNYRFVVTTRPLPDEELAPLSGSQWGAYRIEPFQRRELQEFASGWFREQDPDTATEQESRFLRQIEDGRLRELVRNPLLATIAAVAQTREPQRPLPTNRADLYDRFHSYLVTDAGGRHTFAEFRRLASADPTRLRLADWLHGQRGTIVDFLARKRMEGSSLLLEVAQTWIRENHPGDLELPSGWEHDVRQLLIDTGVFVYEGDGVKFHHLSFAEFLAARSHARSISVDFPEAEAWIARGLKEAERNFALFTMALWGRRPEHDTGIIVRKLLEGGNDRLLLAGYLLGEGIEIEDDLAKAVVDRLIGLAMLSSVSDLSAGSVHADRFLHSNAKQVFRVIAGLTDNAYTVERLHALIDSPELSVRVRAHAAVAFGSISDTQRALDWLRELCSEGSDCEDMVSIALGIREIAPEETDFIRALLTNAGDNPLCPAATVAETAEALVELGDVETAVRLAEKTLRSAEGGYGVLETAADILAIHRGKDALTPLADHYEATWRSEGDLSDLAIAFAKSGAIEPAIKFAKRLVNSPGVGQATLATAVRAWITAAGTVAVDDIVAALRARPHVDAWAGALIANTFAEYGNGEIAIAFAQKIFDDPKADAYDTRDAAKAWLNVGGQPALPHIIQAVNQQQERFPNKSARFMVAEIISELGYHQEARSIVWSALEAGEFNSYALRAYLNSGLTDDLDSLVEAVRRHNLPPDEIGRLAIELVISGRLYAAKAFAADLLERDGTLPPDALTALAIAADLGTPEDFLEAVHQHMPQAAKRINLSQQIALAGGMDMSTRMWLDVLIDKTADDKEVCAAATYLIQIGQWQQAVDILANALLSPDMQRLERVRLRRLHAWVRLANPRAEDCELCGGSNLYFEERDRHE